MQIIYAKYLQLRFSTGILRLTPKKVKNISDLEGLGKTDKGHGLLHRLGLGGGGLALGLLCSRLAGLKEKAYR
jgi:hypothetical protein